MCYGHDGHAALQQSLDRRGLLRGSLAALAGIGLATGLGATAAQAGGHHQAGVRCRRS
ncbi:hypothetical protein AB0F90_06595 [Micromonospora chalcea]|uniref:hypothetical protein n=1 Tax=Micromonospora chalcea TaxID=1874 RepID=UPI0033D70820